VRIDWADGDYARTATVLAPAADALLEAAGIAVGHRVLDVGCGNGNATLAAAARGAVATGVDAAEGLVAQAQARADAAGLSASFLVQEAERLPVADGAFDATISVFGVIFADPIPAVNEMFRVTRAGGVVGITNWRPEGAVAAAGQILQDAVPGREGPPPGWDDPEWVRELLDVAGAASIEFTEGAVAFEAESSAEWFAQQERYHPIWRAVRRAVSPADWELVRARSIEALDAGNEADEGFRATSPYMVVIATR
jgi:ubiquinone/menaquinone biosynthesis C-methylase UbiE